jgi:hypothetical protein
MKGKSAFFRILASLTAYFKWLFKIRFYFLSAFIAYSLPLSFFSARNTLPNAPLPNSLSNLND